MTIVSSSYSLGIAQKDGRRYVTELHTDSTGKVWPIEYGPVGEIDYQAVMTARAARIAAQLADQEGQAMWDGGAPWAAPVHQSASELATRFRLAYRDASSLRAAKLAWWLIERITAGNITDAQARTAFGLTTQQYSTLKTRMTTLHDQYAGVIAAAGE